ncbi:MAG: PAS domain-containing sensor histidine kinase [Planctomycetaceae bacterium]|nr:PAS domain-containing sensor histidine kinase [Planctomycetaceae bacterium]
MLSSRLFWKLFGVYALLSAVASVSIIGILGGRQREVVYDQVYRRLHDSAMTLLNQLDDPFSKPPADSLSESLKAIAEENGTRITLIGVDGVVLTDSESDPSEMNNHGDRFEVLQAKSEGIGSARRDSPTLGIPMLYLAVRFGEASDIIGYVRVAVPLDLVEKEVATIQRLVVVTSVMVSLVALAPLFLILRRMIHPLATLRSAANAIAAGDLEQSVDVESHDELGTLADAFNMMSSELSTRMTQLKQTTQELHESSQLLQTMFSSMIEGVIAIDNDERILFANMAVCNMLDLGERETVGRPIGECVRSETVREVVSQALQGLGRSVECELPRNETLVEIEAIPLAGDPCPGVVLVFYDVTELRRLENIRRDFVSNVSHELKTPLTIIQAATETLLDGAIEDAEFAKRFLSRIDEQGERLQQLILDLLQLARIESGQAAFEVTAVPVRPLVEALTEELAALAQSRKVTLQINPPEDEVSVEVESDALRTIIENLVSNGLNYTLPGGQVIVAWNKDRAHAVISVSDNGVGISRENQVRIFERFYRVDRARSRDLGGTGLGLSIVKHLAGEFGAQITVDSEVGKGSTFSLRIPLAPKSLG